MFDEHVHARHSQELWLPPVHIRSSLTSDVANTIACSIIGSRLDYCNSLLLLLLLLLNEYY